MATNAQLKANSKYRSNNVKQVNLSFYPKEQQLYEFLCEHENKAGYIKGLIERDYRATVQE